jgi:hypothetical protein
VLGKKTIYYFFSELEEHEIRDKKIRFAGFPDKGDIRIPKTELIIRDGSDMFAEKG